MKKFLGFSLAEALITLLIVCIIAIASAPVITRKHRAMADSPHGSYACYWRGDSLVAKYEENKQVKDGKVVFDENEARYGCEFEPPKGARNFVVTIIGGGGGGAGSAIGSIINKYEDSAYVYNEQPGIFEFLLVGGGGNGGVIDYNDDEKYTPQIRALTGTAGDVVYVPPTYIPKTNMYIGAGKGGGFSSKVTFGSIVSNDGDLYDTYAGGGSGGERLYYKFVQYSDRYVNYINMHYLINNEGKLLSCVKDPGVFEVLDSKSIYEYNKLSTTAACPLSIVKNYGNVGSNGNSASRIKTAVIHEMSKKLNGSIMSVDHQNDKKYNNNEELNRYSEKFGIEFNKKIKGTNYAYFKTTSGHRDFAKEERACSGTDWQTKNYCVDYENNYGAGGGGQGFYGNAMYPQSIEGKSGVVIVKQLKMYAGLGGEAGSVSQTTYQILNKKIVMFPGKGGKGGQYSSSVAKTENGCTGCEETAGESGQSSYIKDSSEVLGGKGASSIYPGNEASYSSYTDQNTSSPIGGNGKLAVAPKEGLTGGLGGFNGNNNTFNGLTQSVFKNDAQLGAVSTITGAGSGGGGGSLIITQNGSDYNIDQGTGGQGASGLVFIQW